MKKVILGIVGLGRLGRKHAENIHHKIQNAELTAICSVVQEEHDSVGEEMHPKYRTSDFRQLIENDELDAIVIASSSQEHCRMLCQAAEAGRKKVYIEKPIQVRMVNRDPAAMAEFIIKFSPTSGGLFMDMLPHDYDCARCFVGSEAKNVYGLGDAFVYDGLRAFNDIDNCNILVAFENGAIVFEYWEPTFCAEMQHFVDCIIQGKEPLVGLEDGYRAVQWACAATEAVRDRRVVEIR